jgi:spermidine synthase
MGFLFKNTSRMSKKNGTISVYKEPFAPWQVSVDDCGQTTMYTHAMWVDLFKRQSGLFKNRQVQTILMLGLGAGGQVGTLHKQFLNCALTAVEYDEEMVTLARELGLHKPFPFPEVLLGDAKDVVPQIQKKFDLIIVDLFAGPEPSPLGQDEAFITQLRERLTEHGVLLMNVYQRKEYLPTAQKLFACSDLWKFRLNHLGAFWQNQKD